MRRTESHTDVYCLSSSQTDQQHSKPSLLKIIFNLVDLFSMSPKSDHAMSDYAIWHAVYEGPACKTGLLNKQDLPIKNIFFILFLNVIILSNYRVTAVLRRHPVLNNYYFVKTSESPRTTRRPADSSQTFRHRSLASTMPYIVYM